jgi:hypothetical protein
MFNAPALCRIGYFELLGVFTGGGFVSLFPAAL